MRYFTILAVLTGLCVALLADGSARACDLGFLPGCGRCGSDGHWARGVVCAAPVYFYARPTMTIIPRVIVQPNYVVERTFVVNQTHVVREASPCWLGCERHLLVDQGQFEIAAPTYSAPEPYPVQVYYQHYYYRPHYARRVARVYESHAPQKYHGGSLHLRPYYSHHYYHSRRDYGSRH